MMSVKALATADWRPRRTRRNVAGNNVRSHKQQEPIMPDSYPLAESNLTSSRRWGSRQNRSTTSTR